MTRGTLSEEIEVKVTADEAWKVYGSVKMGEILVEKLSDMLQKIEIIEGDGGAGSVIKITFAPGMPGPTYLIEKLIVLDGEKHLKIIEEIEGGHLALGFTKFRVLLQVLEKDENTCITKATVEYEIGEEEDASNKVRFASIEPLVAFMKVVADFLTMMPNEA